jgi:hypothetical protein
MGWANRLSSCTSHFIGNVAVKALLCTIERNLTVAGVCGTPDRIAIVKRSNWLRRQDTRGNHDHHHKRYYLRLHRFLSMRVGIARNTNVAKSVWLTAKCCPSAVHFGLGDCSCGDQSSDAGFAQTVTAAAHAIL